MTNNTHSIMATPWWIVYDLHQQTGRELVDSWDALPGLTGAARASCLHRIEKLQRQMQRYRNALRNV